MDSILADEPSVHTLPESAEDVPSPEKAEPAVVADKGATPVAAKDKAPAAAAPAPKVPETATEDDSDEGPMPADLEGFKKALAAARGDKRKARKQWQEAERKLAVFEGQMQERQRQTTQQGAPAKPAQPTREELEAAFYADPIGFHEKQLAARIPDVDAVAVRTRADVSEYYARKSYADYEEKLAYFKQKASQDPSMWQEVFAAAAPAEVVYAKATALQAKEEFDRDPDGWRDAERQRLKAELLGEAGASAGDAPNDASPVAPKPAAQKPIPRSIAGARGSGVGTAQTWSGPRSMDSILSR